MKTLEKEQAVGLRQTGLSYREIEQQVNVSRGSLSRWLRDIELTPDQQRRIHQQNLVIRRKFVQYNHQKRAVALAEKDQLCTQAAQEVALLSSRELCLVGAALYWAEGTKAGLVEFVNSDPAMVALMMRWFRECCGVPEAKFRGRLQLHDPTRVTVVQAFWSQLTGIPLQQFTRPFQKLSPTSQRKRGNCLPNGIIHIRIADVRLLARIGGWIKGLGTAPSSSPA